MIQKGVTAEEMSEIDRKAQEDFGISQSLLMENAGKSVAEVILHEFGSLEGEKIAVFCGKGNNGGDGFVAARYLIKENPQELVIYAMDMGKVKSGAAYDNFAAAKQAGIDIRPTEDFLFLNKGVIEYRVAVDAVFGTGFKGELPEECAALGKKLNSLNIRVYAVDIPSGLNATTGEGDKDVPKAEKTITFGLPKQGFFIKDGPKTCGQIIVKNIGFPQELLKPYISMYHLS